MQPLDQYLNAPVAAYGLSCLLMFVVVGVILTVRALDGGTTLFALPVNAAAVRLLGLVAFVIGVTAYVASGIIVSRESDEAATGLYVLVVILGGIHLLGFVAEILYCSLTNRGPFSLRLVVMLVVTFAIAMFLNARSVMFDGVIAIAVSGIVYQVFRARHLVGLAVAAVLASQIVTPITMELRRVKEGKSASEFASAAGEVIAKAASEPDYVGILRLRQAQESKVDNPLELYEYYGDPTNVMNRFSYVALVDAVYFRAERQVPLGLSALDEVYSRVVPGFLVNKEPKPYGYGDWLSWELGIFQPPLKTFTNFGLPMEGYAVAGTLRLRPIPDPRPVPDPAGLEPRLEPASTLSVQSAPVRSDAVADRRRYFRRLFRCADAADSNSSDRAQDDGDSRLSFSSRKRPFRLQARGESPPRTRGGHRAPSDGGMPLP